MADALCGPSNALQNFQKHAAIDRSLQQDRIGFRAGPSQSFRTSPAPGISLVDADFKAFQAGKPLLNDQLQFPPQQGSQIRTAQPSLPNWAADFQKLRLNDHQPPSAIAGFSRNAAHSNSAPSHWHQEFIMRQQQSSFQPAQTTNFSQSQWQPQISTYSPMISNSILSHSVQQHEESLPGVAEAPVFDDAAFERAFEAIDSHIEETESKGKGRVVEREPVVKFDLSHASMEIGDVTGDYDYEGKGSIWASELQSTLKEAGWEALDAFQRAHEQEFQTTGSQESLEISKTIKKMRSEEERSSQSQSPEPATEPLRIGADTIPATQQEAEPASQDAEADELARTAAQLIDNLKDEQSSKFQQSNFMQLMRQLRDKEVRIEGDSMVKQSPHPGGKFYPTDAFANVEGDATQMG